MLRFELVDGSASKFWEVEVEDCALTVRFGRIGTAGQAKAKDFSSNEAALRERDKLIKEKTGKGYVEQGSAVPAAASAASATAAIPAPVSGPAPAKNEAAPVNETAAAVPQASGPVAAGPIVWPTAGFVWNNRWRDKLPVVRGYHVPALALPREDQSLPIVFPDIERPEADKHIASLGETLDRKWKIWGEAGSRRRISAAALQAPDKEFWLELFAQDFITHSHTWKELDHRAVHAALSRHSVAFVLEVVLELWRAAASARAFRNAFRESYFPVLRHAIAAADEKQYAQAEASAERLRKENAGMLIACACLFPHKTEWAVAALAKRDSASFRDALGTCVLPLDLAQYSLPEYATQLKDKYPQVLLFLLVHGEQAHGKVLDLLDITHHKHEAEDLMRLLADLHTAQIFDKLLGRFNDNQIGKVVLGTLDKLAEQYCAAAVVAAMSRDDAACEAWGIRQALRDPAAAQAAATALPVDANARLRAALARFARPEAAAKDLPALLTSPPWLQKQRANELPVLNVPLPAPDTDESWSAAERQQYLERQASRIAQILHALSRGKTYRAAATAWVAQHTREAAVYALALAFGSAKPARSMAQSALRWMQKNGYAHDLQAAAADYGSAMQGALKALQEQDPLTVLPAKTPRLPAFFVPGTCHRPELKSGGALPLAAVEHVATMLAIGTLDAPYAGIDLVRDICTPESLAEFAWDVFKSWLAVGAPIKENWAFAALGVFGNDDTAHRLAPLIRIWPGESAHLRAVAGLDLLAAIGSDVALMHLNAIAHKVKFKALQERAREKIEAVAQARGFTAEELADRLVPDLGLDEAGALTLDFGPRQFIIAFDAEFKPYVKDAQGTRLKDLPAPNRSDDTEKADAAVQRFKQLKKEAKSIAALQLSRLESAMVNQRRWPAAAFRLFFLEHPLMRLMAARLVWATYSEGKPVQLFRIAEDWSLAGEGDELFLLADNAVAGIVHPLEAPAATLAAFGQIFADYEIIQPFEQLGRETYALEQAEQAGTVLTRFADRTVATGSVLGLANHGWNKAGDMESGWLGSFSKSLPGGWQVELTLDPGTNVADTRSHPKQSLPAVTLSRPDTAAKDEKIAFSGLGPILTSEVLRDIELLAKA